MNMLSIEVDPGGSIVEHKTPEWEVVVLKPTTTVLCHQAKNLSRLVGKPTICISENKGADQLHSNCEADQHLCFRYSDSTIPLLLKSEI